MKSAIELAREGLAIADEASPGPWEWWTSNSMRRLTGPDGKDGGVLSAYRAADGFSCVSVSDGNAALIEAACNNYATLCRKLIEIDAYANLPITPEAGDDYAEGVADTKDGLRKIINGGNHDY